MLNQDPPQTIELELKLLILANDQARLKRHPLLRDISPHRAVISELDAIYFDTDSMSLAAKGLALRLRQSGGLWVQTVKAGGESAAGLHQRLEWEMPREGEVLRFDDLPEPALRPYLEELQARSELKPIFRTRFTRWARLLVLPDGTQIELALDHGHILVDDTALPISEIELELKSGQPSKLFQLALGFAADIALYPESKSKAERGYALKAGTLATPFKSRIPQLERSLHPRKACAAFIQSALEQLQRNLEGATLGQNSEFIHQARIALRRLRATFGVFRGILSEDTLELRNELRWLMNELGPARDWDVFLESTLPGLMETMPGEPGMAWLETCAQGLRAQAQQRAATALGSRRTPLILLKLGALAQDLIAPTPVDPLALPVVSPEPSLTEFARQVLKKRARRAGVNADELARWDMEARHAWRITLKKLRYSGDFLAPVFGRKGKTRRWIDALAALQDILGSLNDAATTERLIETLKPRTRPQREICATLRGFTAGASFARMQELERARAQLEKAPGPWRA